MLGLARRVCTTPNAAARFASAFLPTSDLSRFIAFSAALDALHSALEAKEHEQPARLQLHGPIT